MLKINFRLHQGVSLVETKLQNQIASEKESERSSASEISLSHEPGDDTRAVTRAGVVTRVATRTGEDPRAFTRQKGGLTRWHAPKEGPTPQHVPGRVGRAPTRAIQALHTRHVPGRCCHAPRACPVSLLCHAYVQPTLSQRHVGAQLGATSARNISGIFFSINYSFSP